MRVLIAAALLTLPGYLMASDAVSTTPHYGVSELLTEKGAIPRFSFDKKESPTYATREPFPVFPEDTVDPARFIYSPQVRQWVIDAGASLEIN